MNRRPRVLVADDHRAMLDSLVSLLSRDFDVVATVTDGLAAVTEAEHLEPDLLVLDIAMPRLNGIAAAARLKEHGSKAKIVFVTNMRDREFVSESAGSVKWFRRQGPASSPTCCRRPSGPFGRAFVYPPFHADISDPNSRSRLTLAQTRVSKSDCLPPSLRAGLISWRFR